ncbi:MAG TPA: exodeoxyribonuclease VII large subunit [Gemmatimonadales bacterium]|jgi:exodeoxyribonuclease VII large subunit|nr:exodeoxyribonuclease VII large subunit [Gemmatimonadales bacterium]
MGASVDLFSAASAEGAWTVGEVTKRARAVIEAGLPPLWVRGEIAGFKAWRSGHWYFSLRDKAAQIRCAMFAKQNFRLPPPTDGMQVFVFARPSIYEEKGDFQLTVLELLSTDQGGLWKLAFEKAKAALTKDGLLDPARKRRLPLFPRRIAVVTSPDGAVLRDIQAVVGRRWPLAELIVVPAQVQGAKAEASVCSALNRIRRLPVDVLIVGRGGGSIEDLWAFNTERVARAVAAMPMPVISAIGHETDVTLCDLVADLRAPTPSAAAEAATPDRSEIRQACDALGQRLARALRTASRHVVERLNRTSDRLTRCMEYRLEKSGARLTAHGARLDALSPLKVLARGYAVARDQQGAVLKSVGQLPPGKEFRLRVTDGEVDARVR